MDDYTDKTKQWLEDRFKTVDKDGVYFAHQPVYGFAQGHCEGGIHDRYIITYEIMRALAHLKFSSFLDVGAAEGYKAFVVKRLFGAEVVSSDISQEACRRAQELFNIKAIPGDVHGLPFQDDAFDVALCSESLEHVTDWKKGVAELLRVARKAVIITLPHDLEDFVTKEKETHVPHGHIHHFDLDSMNFLKKDGYRIIAQRIVRTKFRIPQILIDKKERIYNPKKNKYPRCCVDLYNFLVYFPLKFLLQPFSKVLTAVSIEMDHYLLKVMPAYQAVIFIILKDQRCYSEDMVRRISAGEVMRVTVPFLRRKCVDV